MLISIYKIKKFEASYRSNDLETNYVHTMEHDTAIKIMRRIL